MLHLKTLTVSSWESKNFGIYIVTVITKIFKGHSRVNLTGPSSQDASFITSEHGKHGRKKPPAPDISDFSEKPGAVDREEAKRQARRVIEEKKHLRKDERRESMTRRSRDGRFANKDGKNSFWFKQHSSHGVDMSLVQEFVITTASVNDPCADLSIPGMPCYSDRGYQVSLTGASRRPWIVYPETPP